MPTKRPATKPPTVFSDDPTGEPIKYTVASSTQDLLLPQAMVDPRTLVANPGNPRVHQEQSLRGSVRNFGQYRAVIVNSRTGQLVAGHGTVEALIAEGVNPIQVSYIDVDEETADEILLFDNWSSDNATNDDRLLAEMLRRLSEGGGLERTGFVEDDLHALETLLGELDANDSDDGPGDGDDGDGDDTETPEDAMALAGVVVGEPPIKTHHGEVWKLGRHHLVVADVHTDWAVYTPYLHDGDLFWPYPTLLAPFAMKAKETPVVMVQPSLYLSGWLIAKWARVTGHEPVLVNIGRAA